MENKKMLTNIAVGTVVGAALGYLYLITLGKGKNLKMVNVLSISGGIGLISGALLSSTKKKPAEITEEDLRSFAKTINVKTENEVDGYLDIIRRAKNISEQERQRVFKVINAMLLAKKDKKWDEKADIETKKQIILQYGVSQEEFASFNDIVIKGLSDILAGTVSDLLNPKNK